MRSASWYQQPNAAFPVASVAYLARVSRAFVAAFSVATLNGSPSQYSTANAMLCSYTYTLSHISPHSGRVTPNHSSPTPTRSPLVNHQTTRAPKSGQSERIAYGHQTGRGAPAVVEYFERLWNRARPTKNLTRPREPLFVLLGEIILVHRYVIYKIINI